MKTTILTAAVLALFATVAHAESPPAEMYDTLVTADDTPDCVDISPQWVSEYDHARIELNNRCGEALELTCPTQSGCMVEGDGVWTDVVVVAPGSAPFILLPPHETDLPWQMGELGGTLVYETMLSDYGGFVECGTGMIGCSATPSGGAGATPLLAFALLGLGFGLRRRRR